MRSLKGTVPSRGSVDGDAACESVEDRHQDLRHAVWITDQLLRGISGAMDGLKGKDRQRLERQRRLLTREREAALGELAEIDAIMTKELGALQA
jgi:hypothetical protein